VPFVRRSDASQFARPQQVRQAQGVAPIGLDPIAWPARNEPRRNDLARVTERADQPIKDHIRGWPRLVLERQPAMLGQMTANKLRPCRIARFDLPRKPHLARPYAPASATAMRDFETSMPTKTSLSSSRARPPCVKALPGLPGNPPNAHRGRAAASPQGHTVWTFPAFVESVLKFTRPASRTEAG